MFLFVNLKQSYANEFVMNSFRPKMPPFGIAYCAAMLRKAGIPSVLHDDNAKEFTDEQLRQLFKKYKGQVQAVGLSSISTTLSQMSRVGGIAKEIMPEVPVVVGGPHAMLVPTDIMKYPEVDVVFTSEAELAILDFARGVKCSDINGIMYRDDGKIKANPVKNNYAKNLDDIPFPDYSIFNIAEYRTTKGIGKRHPNTYIITSRGCPYNCTFCSSRALNPTDKKTARFRSPENVVAEIEMLIKDYKIKELFFSDDIFTVNAEHLLGICEGIIRKKLDIVWVCQTHVNTITREKLKVMKKAGCHQICFGIESGDAKIQKLIQKNLVKELSFDRAREAVKLTQQAGIDARCSFMFGNQHETPETMQATIDLAVSLKPDFASFNIATPYPGTSLREWAVSNGYLVDERGEALDSTGYILVTPSLPAGTVESHVAKAFKTFYYSPAYMVRRFLHIRDMPDLVRFFLSAMYAIKSLPSICFPAARHKALLTAPADAAECT